MSDVLGYAPIAAAVFAIPEFVPQILRLRATRDCAGVSWPWVALTAVNNTAWLGYFALSHYPAAIVPSGASLVLAAASLLMLVRMCWCAARGSRSRSPAEVAG